MNMNKLQINILETIRKYNLISPYDRILLGFSGGYDSSCLINVLNSIKKLLKFELFAVHVNHNLRNNSLTDYKGVKERCENLKVKLFYESVNVKRYSQEGKVSIEMAGREIRYDIFTKICKSNNFNKVATAHNLNDSVESTIMHLMRGSGMSGLRGIQPSVKIKNNEYDVSLIRPLIQIERNCIEKYCKRYKVNAILDESNSSDDYFRNEVRHRIMPFVVRKNALHSIDRLGQIVCDENQYLDKIVDELYRNVAVLDSEQNTITIEKSKIQNLHISLYRRLILMCTKQLKWNDINYVQIDSCIDIINKGQGNKKIQLPNGCSVIFKRGTVTFNTNNS